LIFLGVLYPFAVTFV